MQNENREIKSSVYRWLSLIFLSALFFFSLATSVFAATSYYVSPTGSDSNAGTSASPFATIQRAADVVNPGDTVIVKKGTYSASKSKWNILNITRGGTSSNWVTFKSETKWGARLDGQGNPMTTYGVLITAPYVRLADFEIVNITSGATGVYVKATNVQVNGNHIHDIGRRCTDSPYGNTAMYIQKSSSVVIQRNAIHDIGRFEPGENGCSPTTRFYQNNDHGLYIDGSNKVTVESNIFYNHKRGWAVHVYSSDGSATSFLTIVNNTFAFPNPYRDGHIILASGGVATGTIQNNIFYSPRTAGVNVNTIAGPTTFSNVLISNNLTYGGVVNSGTAPGVTISNNVDNTDPQLVNPAGSDFHILPGSSAIDTALALHVGNDFDGKKRPQGSGYDYGAYEYGGTAALPLLPPLPPSLLEYYRQVYDQTYTQYQSTYDSMAANPTPNDVYYTFQYAFGGTLSMYEATKDVKYLERGLAWAETMMSKATVVGKENTKNWPGPWYPNPVGTTQGIYYQLWDFQGSTELARLARLILTNPDLRSNYGVRATTLYNFVRHNIVHKHWNIVGSGPIFLSNVKDQKLSYSDKVALLLRILMDTKLSSDAVGDTDFIGGSVYTLTGVINDLAAAFKSRLVDASQDSKCTSYNKPQAVGGIIWDCGMVSDFLPNHAQDTSHANRFPYMVLDLNEAGRVFARSDIEGLAKLFNNIIWNGSLTNPMFTNFIDGNDDPSIGGLRLIYQGWVTLAEYDQKTLEIMDAVLRAVVNGTKNSSLDFMNNLHGRAALAGHLARAVAQSGKPPPC